jgi:UDP:flavonoid glycosyltransferase YjiC (YdhE family)
VQAVFTCVPGHGHLNPLVPVAHALTARGCDVQFVTGGELVPRVEELGFVCSPAGPTLAEMEANALADANVRAALETEPWIAAAAIFGGRAGPVLEDLDGVPLNPDLVVHDAMELAGPIIAARNGVPWVTHGLGPRWPALVEDAMPGFVDEVWRANGLEPVARGGLGHHAFIEICPPAVRSDNRRPDDRIIESRPVPLQEPATPFAAFGDNGRPNVYCTLGTFTNSNADVFRTLIDAFSSLDVDVLVTTGGGIDSDELELGPANVTVEAYVPQAQVLARADLVVCHGGSGTMLASLGAGIPIVSIPQGADQFINAPWWARSGAVTVLPSAGLEPASIAASVASALEDRAMRAAAASTALDMAAMPSPTETAERLIEFAGR